MRLGGGKLKMCKRRRQSEISNGSPLAELCKPSHDLQGQLASFVLSRASETCRCSAIDALGRSDFLVLPEWDLATRSMIDGVHIIKRIHACCALLKVLDKPHLDLTTPIGRGFIAFLSALAEDERQRIVKRANDDRKAARAQGAKFGRKPKLNEHQRKEAVRRLASGESTRAVARTFAVHDATVARLRARA